MSIPLLRVRASALPATGAVSSVSRPWFTTLIASNKRAIVGFGALVLMVVLMLLLIADNRSAVRDRMARGRLYAHTLEVLLMSEQLRNEVLRAIQGERGFLLTHEEKFAAPLAHPKERETAALGEALFYRRSGPFDFACATCHANSGLRIRLQGLPYLAEKKEASKVIGEWPAYRVSSTHVMTMQHRLYDCYWQMRMPELQLGSDASVALIAFLTRQADGGEITAPGLKR